MSGLTAFATDPGPRDSLEDTVQAMELSVWVPSLCRAFLLVVCDGVASRMYGHIASALVTSCICSYVFDAMLRGTLSIGPNGSAPDDLLGLLSDSLHAANNALLRQCEVQRELRGMATTAVCALVVDRTVFIASAGDSRAYHFSRGSICQVTHDHSEAQKLVDAGLLQEHEAKDHPLAHTINKYVGMPTGFACDTWIRHLIPGDVLLLCSDGLTDVLADDQIAEHIASRETSPGRLQDLPHLLVQEALHAGTTDNVTVLCYEQQVEHPSTRTRTGAYPAAAARAIRELIKETSDE